MMSMRPSMAIPSAGGSRNKVNNPHVSNSSLSPELTFEPAHYSLWWPVAGLLATLVIVFYPYLFEGKIMLPTDMFDTMTAPFNAEYGPPQAQNHYFWDGIVQTYPYKVETQEALRSGHLAYWNPHILSGYPQYAETMGNNFDPFNVLLLWVNIPTFILLQTIFDLLVAGIGMILLLRYFGVSPSVNFIFSGAYMLNSLFVTSAIHRWTIASFCWVPFVVLMVLRYFNSFKKKNLIYASFFLALAYLGGNLQSSFFVSSLVAGIVLLFPSSSHVLRWYHRITTLIFIGCVAFLLTALMWLPVLQLFWETLSRGSLNSSSIYSRYSIVQRILSLPMLIVFYFPSITGSVTSFNLKTIAGADIDDFNGAIAFVPALFAFWGCFALRRNKKLFPFILLAVLAILLPIATPLYSFLYHRVFIIATFCFCVVGAVLFESFIKSTMDRDRATRFVRRCAGALGLLILTVALLCGYLTVERSALTKHLTESLQGPIQNSAFGAGNKAWMFSRIGETLNYFSFTSVGLWLPILLAVIAMLAMVGFSKGKLRERGFLTVVAITTSLQLILFATMWLPRVDTGVFPAYPPNPIITFLHSQPQGNRFMAWRNAATDPYILAPNASNAYHIEDFSGYESLTAPSMSVLYRRYIPSDSLDLRLLGLSSVKWIVARTFVPTSSNVRPVFSADGLTVYQ
ncbi:MAG TPA: hypothetical protein VFX22_00265, partial [Candidatus Kapabacteria bacterium]|nr:hypothetical protein [Candidatus Kapabacteria bacterium]